MDSGSIRKPSSPRARRAERYAERWQHMAVHGVIVPASKQRISPGFERVFLPLAVLEAQRDLRDSEQP